MKLLISVVVFFCLFISCKNNSTNNTSTSTGAYFVDWTVDGTHYHSTATYNLCGVYAIASSALTINGSATNSDKSVMSLKGAIDNLKATGTYSGIAVSNVNTWVLMEWVPDSLSYYLSTDSTGANLSYTITSLSGPVTGSFTGKLAAPVVSGSTVTFKYVNVQGTFSIPVF